MPKPVLLNNVDHAKLRVITRRGARFGDNQMAAVTFPAEFRNVQACYPIVFRKTTDAIGFEPIALLGFQEEENLFLDGERWDAVYIPMLIERQPFLIGMGGADGQELTVHIDIENPRVTFSDSEGEEVFKPHGGITDYHLHLNYAAAQGPGLVLYPHFQRAVVPGWLDKALKWRHRATHFLDNMLLLAPHPEWIKTLPNGKLPDRKDFTHYGNDLAGRVQAWSRAVQMSRQLAEEFQAWLERPDPARLQAL